MHALWHAQGHKEGLQRKAAERAADLRAKREQLAAAHADNEGMRARIAAQTISRDDVVRMNHERCAHAPLPLQGCLTTRHPLIHRSSGTHGAHDCAP